MIAKLYVNFYAAVVLGCGDDRVTNITQKCIKLTIPWIYGSSKCLLPHENPGSKWENMVAFATKIPQISSPASCSCCLSPFPLIFLKSLVSSANFKMLLVTPSSKVLDHWCTSIKNIRQALVQILVVHHSKLVSNLKPPHQPLLLRVLVSCPLDSSKLMFYTDSSLLCWGGGGGS